MYRTDPTGSTDPTKKASLVASTPAPTIYTPPIGKTFYPRGVKGNWRIRHNDAASKRTMIRNEQTGAWMLVPYDRIDGSINRKAEMTNGQEMTGQQANYFMNASKSPERYQPDQRARLPTPVQSQRTPTGKIFGHAAGAPVGSTGVRRNGGILYIKGANTRKFQKGNNGTMTAQELKNLVAAIRAEGMAASSTPEYKAASAARHQQGEDMHVYIGKHMNNPTSALLDLFNNNGEGFASGVIPEGVSQEDYEEGKALFTRGQEIESVYQGFQDSFKQISYREDDAITKLNSHPDELKRRDSIQKSRPSRNIIKIKRKGGILY